MGFCIHDYELSVCKKNTEDYVTSSTTLISEEVLRFMQVIRYENTVCLISIHDRSL